MASPPRVSIAVAQIVGDYRPRHTPLERRCRCLDGQKKTAATGWQGGRALPSEFLTHKRICWHGGLLPPEHFKPALPTKNGPRLGTRAGSMGRHGEFCSIPAPFDVRKSGRLMDVPLRGMRWLP